MDRTTYSALAALSAEQGRKISDVSLDLIQESLGLQEDLYFSQAADKRLKRKHKRSSHRKAWLHV